jgi:hypothetical protein
VLLILAPPAAVAALPAGATLEGVVLPPPPQPPAAADAAADARAADARAVVTVRTPAGDVTLRLPLPLPPGSDVELQVVRASPDQATVRLVAVNDQPAAQVLAQLRQAATAPTPVTPPPAQQTLPPATVLPPANAWTPQGPVALPALGTVSAYVIQGAPPVILPSPVTTPATAGGVPPAAPPFTLSTGGALAIRITAVQLPAQGAATAPLPAATPVLSTPVLSTLLSSAPGPSAPLTAPAPTTPAPVIQTALSPPTPPNPPVGPLAQPAPPSPPVAVIDAPIIPTGTPLTSQPAVVVAGPQGLPPPPPIPPLTVQNDLPQAVLTGVVQRSTPNSPPVIVTALGEIQLNVRANLPVGTRVTFEVALQLPPQPGGAPPPLPLAALPLSGPPSGATTVGWPNVSEALVQLQRADPAAAAQFAEAIPDGGPRTTVAIIAFAQAMRSGDSRAWPGDANLRALESTGPRGAHLARQIGDEVQALATRAGDGGGSEWRALPVPWNADGRIDRIILITRREGEAEDAGNGKKGRGGGTRFLVNLDLSRLGPLQLDGMFRKDSRGLDVVIRTHRPLADDLRLALTGVFGASTSAMGLTGAVSFQVVRKFPDPVGQAPDKLGLWA